MNVVLAGKQDAVDATLVALEVIAEPMKSMAHMLVDICAYAGLCNSSVKVLTVEGKGITVQLIHSVV